LALAGFAVRDFARAWLGAGTIAGLEDRMLSFAELRDTLGVGELGAGPAEPWRAPALVYHAGLVLDSFARLLGRELVPRGGGAEAEARRLFEAPLVVVSHGGGADPLLEYGNRRALERWETDWESFLGTPSRLTAEPVHRDERARLLERTTRDGFVTDYAGIRVSRSGRRFRIEEAVVWNLVDAEGRHRGQAAAFDRWTDLPDDPGGVGTGGGG